MSHIVPQRNIGYNSGMEKYQVIFSDVDGTLLDSSLNVQPKTIGIIRMLNKKGIPFILVSARMPSTMTYIVDELGVPSPMISYSGALTLDADGNEINGHEISADTALDLYDFVHSDFSDVNLCVYYGPDWIVDDITDPRIQAEVDIVHVTPTEADIKAYISEAGRLHKMFCVGDPTRTTQLTDELNTRYPTLFACKSHATYIEIISREASKERAVADFCQMNQIDMQNIIAFGDHHNDVGMLKRAGLGVAMGNAMPEVKAVSSVVTAGNDEEGIYLILDQLMHEGKL